MAPLSPSSPDARARIRYHDPQMDCEAVKLLPNEFYVAGRSDDEHLMLTTVLGSCVAACVRDRVTGIGGMNHFMLPGTSSESNSMRYGSYAMEVLINEILQAGGQRQRLEAKVFGGAAVLAGFSHLNIGAENADFVLAYLDREGIPIVAQDLLGNLPRRVNYVPHTGKALVMRLHARNGVADVAAAERRVRRLITEQPVTGSVEILRPIGRKKLTS